ncbi:Chromatin structure remodeling complex protein sfh1 [Tieghemiomyces parasiticus]|uniref:Chromatin structure remodeling complex protein sfh1 n=1 Tax=Tieghemiomyces parasiticus TaxID=78921 RepID=A0A9W8DJT3_9FUNG|nr:Chromatin structure remodeling complex protein sfh1 [Tieghemiomyces parasiticus]
MNLRPIASTPPNRLASIQSAGGTYDKFFAAQGGMIGTGRVPMLPQAQLQPLPGSAAATNGVTTRPSFAPVGLPMLPPGMSPMRPGGGGLPPGWSPQPGKGAGPSAAGVFAGQSPLAQRLAASMNTPSSASLQPHPGASGVGVAGPIPMQMMGPGQLMPRPAVSNNAARPGGMSYPLHPGARPNLMTPPHQHQRPNHPHHPQAGSMHPGARHASPARPPPPSYPVPARPNTFTTYAARLQDGSTTLIVPQDWANSRGGLAPGGGIGGGGGGLGGGGRRRTLRHTRDDSESEPESESDDDTAQPATGPVGRPSIVPGQPAAVVDGQVISRVMKGTDHIYLDDYALLDLAQRHEFLIPIRVDLDLDTVKLHDMFLWNLNEPYMSPEKFAQLLCTDLNVVNAANIESISQSIRAQLIDHSNFYELQKTRHQDLVMRSEEASAEQQRPVDHYTEPVRVTVQLELQVGKQLLRDQFQWDLTTSLEDPSMQAMPEYFARQLAADLGVGGEYVPLIAHSVREQLLRYQRERLDLENDTGIVSIHYPDEHEERFPGGRQRFTSNFTINVLRPPDEGKHWTPHIDDLTQDDLEKILIDKERSMRRMRRETARLLQSSRGRRGSPYPTPGGGGYAGNNPLTPTRSSRSGSQMQATPSSSRGPTLTTPSLLETDGAISKPASASGSHLSRLPPEELAKWRCSHCCCNGSQTSIIRKGPDGVRDLCNACGLSYNAHGCLPPNRKNMYSTIAV